MLCMIPNWKVSFCAKRLIVRATLLSFAIQITKTRPSLPMKLHLLLSIAAVLAFHALLSGACMFFSIFDMSLTSRTD